MQLRQGLKETVFLSMAGAFLVLVPIFLAGFSSLSGSPRPPLPGKAQLGYGQLNPESFGAEEVHARLAKIFGAKFQVNEPVPRIFLASLPDSLTSEQDARRKKHNFTTTLLPLILRANELITEQRRYAQRLRKQLNRGQRLSAGDTSWTKAQLKHYRLNPDNMLTPADLDKLLYHLDIIPPSLALAQAAIETGWGTSFFSQEGNALYGEWTWGDEAGILPRAREEGKTHRIKSFDFLLESVVSYMSNLNRHPAYADLRARRAELRRHNLPVTGPALATGLSRYSERGMSYVTDIMSIINYNGFSALDNAELAES